MKKILSMILALTMIFALCACGQSAAPAATEAPAAADTAAPAEAADSDLAYVQGFCRRRHGEGLRAVPRR